MKSPFTFSFAIIIGFALASVGTSIEAYSSQKTKKVRGTSTNAVGNLGTKPSIFVPLTEAECTGLGGKILPTAAGSCNATGKVCYTTDQDGVIRSSCITAN
jgi:hypothetical protein